ncbi:hypothetical protein N180_10450 [Pedobacter antarcticus 4BY]|uniref:Uncharacterized protein n=2 Tax=Pedobacter antarcticus TaxID=34086 RepID=A0A081PJ87_9SPHI|nr:hypothetical protein [Pedobacter antarcticus]KEQ30760.1 hypothetical protein N180_10450 [Pedobacter antarcticus 4BY]SFE91971.1 hypothetical protein SAMN03003324_01809 [Pedobacter antarcticus]
MHIKIGLFLLLTSLTNLVTAQNITYQLQNPKDGSSNTVSVSKTGDEIQINILARWNDQAETYGQFNGKGKLEHGQAVISSDSNACKVKLNFTETGLQIEFMNCDANRIPEHFSGTYTKIADQVTGDYQVSANISYYFSKPNLQSRKKGFLKAGDQWQIEEVFPGNWAFATLRSGDKTLFGYVRLQDLRFVRTYLFD